MSQNGNGYHEANGNGAATLNDHLPPQNLEAERSVLGAILIDGSLIAPIMAVLDVEDLYRDAHQMVYRVMRDLHENGVPIDPITVSDELQRRNQYKEIGGDDFLLELANSVPHSANARYHAEIVGQKSISRQIIQSATDIVRDGYSNLFTSDQLRLSALAKIEAISSRNDSWPELALSQEPEAPAFPTGVFPTVLDRFCRAVSAATLTSPDVTGMAMLATASAAIGQSCNIYLKRTWHESPLLYAVFVAEPGKSKTPPMRIVARPLTNLDGELRDRSKDERHAWDETRKAIKGADPGPEPPQLRARVQDITRETLVAILADNPRGVLADPDEATGWVGSFDQYKSKGTDRQFWLDLWSSRPISVDREAGRRSYWVGSPFVTVFGGIPPDMLNALGEEQGRNDGFLDRLLFAFPSDFPKQQWLEDEVDEADEKAWHAIVRAMHAAKMHQDEQYGRLRPHLVGFTNEAKAIWVQWFNMHCELMEQDDAPTWVPGVYSKLRAYCARFALILSRLRLATNPDLSIGDVSSPVSESDVRGAIALVDYFKGHAARVQHRMTGGTGNKDAQAVLGWIKRKELKEFREAEIRENLRRRFPDLQSLSLPLRILTEAGAIRPRHAPRIASKPGPKPSRTFEVHPLLLQTLAHAEKRPMGAPEITSITPIRPETPF
jgi:Protein of unknown function (DUF3987)/DnaB-like helicase N terminal domain